MIHYFDKAMAYTGCYQLAFGPMAVEHSNNAHKVTCPICLDRLADYYLALTPEEINGILRDCDADTALEFLEVLGQIRASKIYYKEAE